MVRQNALDSALYEYARRLRALDAEFMRAMKPPPSKGGHDSPSLLLRTPPWRRRGGGSVDQWGMLIVVMALVLAVLAAERRCSTVGRQWKVTRPRQHSEERSSVSLTR